MKNFRKNLLLISLFLLTFIISCTSFSKKDWESLQDRNFYFQKFLLVKKGINDKIAFEKMKSFPVDKMLVLLAHKYNITIDSSEYADFITSNTAPQYEDKSLVSILRSEYNWESAKKDPNNIELTYYFLLENNNFDESIKFKIVFNIQGQEKQIIFVYILKTESTIDYLAQAIGYSRLNPKSDNIYVNNETKAQVDLTKAAFLVQAKIPGKNIEEKNKILSEETIKQNIKTYISKMPVGNRKKFRDNIIKFLYAEIE
jgi:hypothetical protein